MKISQIIDKIDEQQLFVPAFQREYVWKKPDAKKLINSLIKDYPTGTMLTWETNNPPELKGNHTYSEKQGSVKLILDGQQRITTLYMLITGEIPPYYTEKEIIVDIRNLFVNIETLELEYYKKKKMENNPVWLNITDIFKKNIRPRDITDKLEEINENERLSREVEDNIYNNISLIEKIKDREFIEQIIPVKASIREAIDIFYIVNASGVNLTDAELALAQISGYWPTARAVFKKKLEELSEQGWVFSLDFIIYILLAILHKQGSKMEKLHSSENKENIQNAWRILENSVLDYTFNIMKSQAYIDHTKEINSVYALIPIITYVFNKPKNKLNENEIKIIVKWFYYSQIRQRYISQLPQKLDKDIGIVFNTSNPFEQLLQNIAEERPLEIKASEFVGRDVRHPLFYLMTWYFKSIGAVCLGTGITLRQNMGKKYSLENDHIFAYSLLRDSEYFDMEDRFQYALAQEITNRQILTQVENRTKSAMQPDVYLKEVKKNFPNSLRLQCIPDNEELWKLKNYEKFLEARRELLSEKLNEYLNNISISSEYIKADLNIQDLIDRGEDENLEFKSTLRWNVKESKLDKKMEEVILKTISSFSNSEGGKLLIGINDDGEILGLDDDYNTLKKPDKDGFELHLRNLLNSNFNKEFSSTNVKIRFYKIDEKEICEVDVKAYKHPLFLMQTAKSGQKEEKFYVRNGNSSIALTLSESSLYIKDRF